MYFPRYWHRSSAKATNPSNGAQWPLNAWGWDEHSQAVAEELSRKRLAGVVERVEKGLGPGQWNWYEYEERPLREERLEEIAGESGSLAVVTRSRSGPLVLNTASIMFVDIDLPDPQPTMRGCLGILFPKLNNTPAENLRTTTLNKIENAASWQSGFAARCYETPAGFRLLVTHKSYDPKSAESTELLESFGADPLFTRLCGKQSCYRARLTAKPWRLGIPATPACWPVPDELATKHAQWLQSYSAACAGTAACRFLQTIGRSTEICPEAQPIIEIHDRLACTGDKLA